MDSSCAILGPLVPGAILTIAERDNLIFWGVILVVAIAVLLIFQKVLRVGFEWRVRGIQRHLAIRPEDLERMERTGLISEEERQRVRHSIARRQMEQARDEVERRTGPRSASDVLVSPAPAEKTSAVQSARTARLPLDARSGKSAEAGRMAAVKGSSPHALEPSPQRKKAEVNLNDLLACGLITREEYEQLGGGGEEDTPSRS